MANIIDNEIDNVVRHLSLLIGSSLSSYALEATHPGADPDRMDDRLKHFKERSANLRRIRQEFEDEMFGKCTP